MSKLIVKIHPVNKIADFNSQTECRPDSLDEPVFATQLTDEVLAALEQDTVAHEGNVRLDKVPSSIKYLSGLAERGEWSLLLPNSALCIQRLAQNTYIVPEGLNRIRAFRRYLSETRNTVTVPIKVLIVDKERAEAIRKFSDTNRPRALKVRVKLADSKGARLTGRVHKAAVEITQALIAVYAGDDSGALKTSPPAVERMWSTEFVEPVLRLLRISNMLATVGNNRAAVRKSIKTAFALALLEHPKHAARIMEFADFYAADMMGVRLEKDVPRARELRKWVSANAGKNGGGWDKVYLRGTAFKLWQHITGDRAQHDKVLHAENYLLANGK